MADSTKRTTSTWSPLRHAVFRSLWIAALVSNVGSWMQNVAGVWLMTSLTHSATLVALMQTATTLPVLLIGLPAAALADILDRRRLILVAECWMLVAAVLLSLVTFTGLVSVWWLLALTFALGVGSALSIPAWQAAIPEMVPPEELHAAVTLNGMTVNIARALGPALGGVIVAAAGPGAVFLLNALSFLAVLWVVHKWRRPQQEMLLPTERLLGAMRAGLRYVGHDHYLRTLLLRVAIFIFFASALWALLPLVAREELGADASGYGALLGCFGAGAVVGAMLLPRLRRSVSESSLVTVAALLFALVTAVLAYVKEPVVLGGVMLLGGGAWIAILSTFNVAVQTAVPRWVQARALGFYLLVFQGGMAVASAAWGALSDLAGNSGALACAALGLAAGAGFSSRWKLKDTASLDLAPALHWPEPHLVLEPGYDEGPVLVTVEYRIDPSQERAFLKALHALGHLRRRDGAFFWSVFYDPAAAGRFVETFAVETWLEHLRQHARITKADLRVEERVRSFLVEESGPKVVHLIHADLKPSRGKMPLSE
jgi:MFS family permease